MPKHKATESESRILSALLFREDYETLRQETQLESGVLRDDLITLINRGWIEVFDPSLDTSETTGTRNEAQSGSKDIGSQNTGRLDTGSHSTHRSTAFYDSDHIEQFSFQATKNGLRGIRHGKL